MSFDEIAWRIAPLGGVVHDRDAKKVQAALTKATEYVGSSFVEKNKDATESGRLSYLDIKEYMYGTQSVEDQKTLLLKDIAKVKFDGGKVGKSFEDCCGDLRTLHQSLDDINRPQSAERKVLGLLEVFGNRHSAAIFLIYGPGRPLFLLPGFERGPI